MIDRVLVPMDDSALSERALRYALDVHGGAQITVLHVVGEPSRMMGAATEIALSDDSDERIRELAADVLDRAREITDAPVGALTTFDDR
jgi:nucleotide-binding universal stress UspA family protein